MVYLSLGTNMGDRRANLDRALELLTADQIQVVQQSSVYETAPRDVVDQPWFLNLVVECEMNYSPDELMRGILQIEKEMGRDRSSAAVHRGPRLIDIDILLYDNLIIQTPQLTVPHPRMLERRFILEPLLELAPELKDPMTGRPLRSALTAVLDQPMTRR